MEQQFDDDDFESTFKKSLITEVIKLNIEINFLLAIDIQNQYATKFIQ